MNPPAPLDALAARILAALMKTDSPDNRKAVTDALLAEGTIEWHALENAQGRITHGSVLVLPLSGLGGDPHTKGET